MRVVADAAMCRVGEMAISWNATGEQGPAGPADPAGPAGPAGAGVKTVAGIVNADGFKNTVTQNGFNSVRLAPGRYQVNFPPGTWTSLPVMTVTPFGANGAYGSAIAAAALFHAPCLETEKRPYSVPAEVRGMGMRYSSQVKSISYLKANAAEVLAQLAEQRQPLVITQNGEAKAVLQDVASFQETQETLALLKILALGNQDVVAGKVKPVLDVVTRLRAKRTNV